MKLAYREAIRAAMRKALHDDPRVFLIGEDVDLLRRRVVFAVADRSIDQGARVLLELKICPPQNRPCCLFPITFRRLIRRWFCRRCHCAGATT